MVVLPLVGLLLVLVFGSVLAALLPLVVGVLEVTGGLAGTLALARFIPVSVFATNVVIMVGFAVAIDYSLFIVSRFRQEVHHHPTPVALARTMATVGRAILFSGVTVAIGLLGMLLLGVGQLGSMGLAGTLVVVLALLYALTFLPALLAILGPRVDAGRLPFLTPDRSGTGPGSWHRLAMLVMAHPWRVLLPVTALLLLLGVPFLHIRLNPSDVTTLPATAESRRGEAILRRDYPDVDTDPIVLLIHDTGLDPLTVDRVGQLFDLSRWLAKIPSVTHVDSLVDLDPTLSRDQYQRLLTLPRAQLPLPMQTAREQTLSNHLVLLAVHTTLGAGSDAARALVRTIRQAHPAIDGELLVTGESAFYLDFRDTMLRNVPRAIGFIVLATYLALFLLLGSLLLPLKAVLMNGLSISASYGALVWIFQDGHLRAWLNFTAGPIETMTPIMMFCVLFGLSMDYEVLMLSRVREEYERTGDTTRAVAEGLESTGRLITGAAAIMALVFFAFGLADMVVIKAIGIGMGIAVVVDATIVRALLVPATMRLLGRWNWWAPAPLACLYRRIDVGGDHARLPHSASEIAPPRAAIESPL
jgi:putative drug exporter of the RND superfamily